MREGHEGGREKMEMRKELEEAKSSSDKKVLELTSELNKNLPKGILGVSFYKDNNRPWIQIDSENNEALDLFLDTVQSELEVAGFKLGRHIQIGFSDDQQSDGWYVQSKEDQNDEAIRWNES